MLLAITLGESVVTTYPTMHCPRPTNQRKSDQIYSTTTSTLAQARGVPTAAADNKNDDDNDKKKVILLDTSTSSIETAHGLKTVRNQLLKKKVAESMCDEMKLKGDIFLNTNNDEIVGLSRLG